MQRDELDVVSVGVSQLRQYLTEGDERLLFRVDVGLIHLVGDNHDFVFVTNLYDVFNVLSLQDLAGWVSRVYHNHASEINPKVFGVCDSLLNLVRIHTPFF